MLPSPISWFKNRNLPKSPQQVPVTNSQPSVPETIAIVPHSCEHCENVLLPEPDDDPFADEYSMSDRSRLMRRLQILTKRTTSNIEDTPRVIDVEPQRLQNLVSEGCLFYEFISKGLKRLHEEEKRRTERKPPLPIPKHSFISAADNQSYVLIKIREWNYSIETMLPFEFMRVHSTQLEIKPHVLHDCVLGFNFSSGSDLSQEAESTWNTATLSPKSFLDRARESLEECVQNHPACAQPKLLLPTRLIKICSGQGTPLIHLEESPKVGARYVALSYCWGGEQVIRTTKESISRHRVMINFQDLPQTLKDAVIVTKSLGLHYLWVDALCIIQDNEVDKSREIDLMGHFYENSDLTILATGASGVWEGFLHNFLSPDYDRSDWVFKMLHSYQDRLCPVIIKPKSFNGVKDFLSERAWAFQERRFSHRSLEFGSACVHWSCRTKQSCYRRTAPCFPHEMVRNEINLHGLQNHSPVVIQMDWFALVDTLSTKSLTFPRDRLPAIAGIAGRFGKLLSSPYFAGIWRSSLPAGLLWTVDRKAIECYQPRSATYLAPSWSWASTLQPIQHVFLPRPHRPAKFFAIINIDIKPQVNGSMYGAVNHGRLTMRGFVIEAHWKLPRRGYLSWDGVIDTIPPGLPAVDIYRDAMETELLAKFPGPNDSMPVYLLVLVEAYDNTAISGIILHKQSDGIYSRLGVFDIAMSTFVYTQREKAYFEAATLQTVTIV